MAAPEIAVFAVNSLPDDVAAKGFAAQALAIDVDGDCGLRQRGIDTCDSDHEERLT